jgi:hypothetical protein
VAGWGKEGQRPKKPKTKRQEIASARERLGQRVPGPFAGEVPWTRTGWRRPKGRVWRGARLAGEPGAAGDEVGYESRVSTCSRGRWKMRWTRSTSASRTGSFPISARLFLFFFSTALWDSGNERHCRSSPSASCRRPRRSWKTAWPLGEQLGELLADGLRPRAALSCRALRTTHGTHGLRRLGP